MHGASVLMKKAHTAVHAMIKTVLHHLKQMLKEFQIEYEIGVWCLFGILNICNSICGWRK